MSEEAEEPESVEIALNRKKAELEKKLTKVKKIHDHNCAVTSDSEVSVTAVEADLEKVEVAINGDSDQAKMILLLDRRCKVADEADTFQMQLRSCESITAQRTGYLRDSLIERSAAAKKALDQQALLSEVDLAISVLIKGTTE